MNSKGIFLSASDTVCSLATQPGGAIGVIRVSGEKAIEITDKVFQVFPFASVKCFPRTP